MGKDYTCFDEKHPEFGDQYYYALINLFDLETREKKTEIFKFYDQRSLISGYCFNEYVVARYLLFKGYDCFRFDKKISRFFRRPTIQLLRHLFNRKEEFKEILVERGLSDRFLPLLNKPGVPDLIVVVEGEFFCVEVKTESDSLRKSQVEWWCECPRDIPFKIAYVEVRTSPSANWFNGLVLGD